MRSRLRCGISGGTAADPQQLCRIRRSGPGVLVKHFTQQVEVCGVLDNDATLIILGAVSGRGRGSQFSSHCAGITMEGLVELEKEHRTYTSDRNELVIEPRKKDPTPHLTILATQK